VATLQGHPAPPLSANITKVAYAKLNNLPVWYRFITGHAECGRG
jgi:hypothetical protein